MTVLDQHRVSSPTTVATTRRRGGPSGADLLAASAWISTAFAVTLYLADGGLHSFSSAGEALRAFGIIAGLVATNAMLFMLALAARIPIIDRTIGQVKAIEWHRNLGNTVVAGVAAHAFALLAGTAALSGEGLIETFLGWWNFDFALAVVGLVLLGVIVVTSIVAVRRKLRYEVWHLVHLLSYAAVIVAIPHMFSMGTLLAPGQWQRVYWATLLVGVGAALLTFRVIVPLAVSFRHDLRLVSLTPISSDTYNFTLSGKDLDSLGIKAGQYLNLRFLARGLWAQAHPFSISAAPNGRTLRVTVKVVGDGTAEMLKTPIGTRVWVEGPYGAFTDEARTRDDLVLIGAGSGIAPIRAMLEATTAEPQRVTVLLRASSPDDLLLGNEFIQICQQRGIRLHMLIGHRAPGRWVPATHAQHTLSTLVPNLTRADLFACGPDGFIQAVLDEAATCGIPQDQLHEERFNW